MDPFADAIDSAIKYQNAGWGIVPAWSPRLDTPAREDGLHPCSCPDGATCTSPGKHPAIPKRKGIERLGFAPYFLKDEDAIRVALANPGTRNYLMVPPPGVVVADLDDEGLALWNQKRRELGSPGQTLTTRTANGFHAAYAMSPEDDPGGNLFGRIVTRRYPGGGVIGPGSVHPSGTVYVNGGPMTINPLAQPWRDALKDPEARPAHQSVPVADVSVGNRHDWLRDEALSYIDRERLYERTKDAEERLWAHMKAYNAALAQPKDDDALRKAVGDPWAALTPHPTLTVGSKPPVDPVDVLGEMRAARIAATAAVPNPDRDKQWLVRNLIRPGTLCVLASAEGLGKSYVRLEIALRGALGTGSLFDYAPFAIGRQFTTALLDEENGEDEEADREEKALARIGVARSAIGAGYARYSFTGADLVSAEGRAKVEAVIEIDKPDLLILDTGTGMVGEEWGPPLKAAIRWLRALSDATGVAVLIVVHLVKPPRDQKSGQRSTAPRTLADVMGQWTRPVDAVFVMSGASGDDRAHFAVHKRVPHDRIVLAQDAGVWTVVAGAATPKINLPKGAGPIGEAIMRAIEDRLDPINHVVLKVSESGFHKALKALREAGLVGSGQPYALTAGGVAALHPDSTETPLDDDDATLDL